MTASLYGDLKAAGVPMDNHESDLYFPCTEKTRSILARFPFSEKLASPFIDKKTGECWLDVPFAYLPWWERRVEFVNDTIEPYDLHD